MKNVLKVENKEVNFMVHKFQENQYVTKNINDKLQKFE